MADEELPLVDVWAHVTAQRSVLKSGGYSITLQIGHGEESRKQLDRKQMDAFLRSKNGDKIVRLVLFEAPAEWTEKEVDPDQGEEDVNTAANLTDRWETMIELMKANA